MNKTLLVEIRTEELPPAQVWNLADAFPDMLLAELQKADFADKNSRRAPNKKFAAPRRFAALLENIKSESPEKEIFRRGPQTAACRDANGAPTKALTGFMQSVGATCENDLIETEEKGKKYVAWKGVQPGKKLADELAEIVGRVLLNISAPRLMRWGENDFKFIRPIRGVLLLHGKTHIGGKIMGTAATKTTKGHPVLSAGEIEIKDSEKYEEIMKENFVIADIDGRQKIIDEESKKIVGKQFPEGALIYNEYSSGKYEPAIKGCGNINAELAREIAAMCEYPKIYVGEMDKDFLSLPNRCVVMCMQKHQRFVPVLEKWGSGLLTKYLIISDNQPKTPNDMRRGYNTVLRARLQDIKFYYEEDKKISLAVCVEKLKSIIFHKKLGNQYDRINRVCQIAAAISLTERTTASEKDIKEAAEKILAPLSTQMVGEYPELQDYMAIQYFSANKYFQVISRLYDLEKIIGMFGADEKATGSKDPHGLRRCANNLIESLSEGVWILGKITGVRKLIAAAVESFNGKIADVRDEVYDFIMERAKFSLARADANIGDSVFSQKPDSLLYIQEKMIALHIFLTGQMEESASLIAANKRINNIFRKSEVNPDELPAPDESLFSEDAERVLWKTVLELKKETHSHLAKNGAVQNYEKAKENYTAALQTMAKAAAPTDAFFDKVLVNAPDQKIRQNRFALLRELRELLNCVADISKLAA